jgi:predicted dehydrogenase
MAIGIVGCGNIASAYAADIATYPELRLVATADIDLARATAVAAAHGARAYGSLDELLADPEVETVVNLTVHHAHHAVTRQALESGRHVYSEKPLALTPGEAHELVALAESRGLRLGCSPATFLGEAQQTAGRVLGDGRLGRVRVVYADVSWGRIETWHPAPAPFFDVGVLFDVGVYPITIVTAFLGPVRSVRAWGWELKPERTAVTGQTFRIGSPDLVLAALELEDGAVVRLCASFYVGRPVRSPGSIEFHGDAGSLWLESFQAFDAAVETADYGQTYAPEPYVRPPYAGTAWGRGLADLALAARERRQHRATGVQAAHVVDVLGAIRDSSAGDGRRVRVGSGFPAPALMDWALPKPSGRPRGVPRAEPRNPS